MANTDIMSGVGTATNGYSNPSFNYQPIMAPVSAGTGFGQGTASAAGAGAGIGFIAGGPAGAAIGAGIGGAIGFIGDLANLWISSAAAKKQEAQTRELNAKANLQYEKEADENKRRFEMQADAANKLTKWNTYKDRENMVNNWSSTFFALANQDQNVKNALVNLWRSAK